MTSYGGAAANYTNRGLVSTATQEDASQPTLKTLLHSLQDWRMPTRLYSFTYCIMLTLITLKYYI